MPEPIFVYNSDYTQRSLRIENIPTNISTNAPRMSLISARNNSVEIQTYVPREMRSDEILYTMAELISQIELYGQWDEASALIKRIKDKLASKVGALTSESLMWLEEGKTVAKPEPPRVKNKTHDATISNMIINGIPVEGIIGPPIRPNGYDPACDCPRCSNYTEYISRSVNDR